MINSSKFKVYQRVKIVAPGQWYNLLGTVWNVTDYSSISVMFNPWVAPKNRRGRVLAVVFKESDLELYC